MEIADEFDYLKREKGRWRRRRIDVRAPGSGYRGLRRREEAVWEPPKSGIMKVNVDGALFKDTGVGLGVVIRDENGRVVRAACLQTKQRWDVPVVEAKAIALGIKLAAQSNATMVEVECDNMQVVSLINGARKDGSQLGIIVREIKCLASCFDSVKFSHVFREANLAAHTMAHLSPLEFSTRVWVGGCPSILDDVIASDFCLMNNNN
ncbi:uncharacterized protein [Spinacia oleracea]|uniref:RNase H type-1 domain-containing protein n=1 Tax=Spinacia oleracea TaxID=3562 RepID=A0ABM3QZ82_SPIOL|nr:uncharacterized protein LOC130463493 [Spinacia oleracea]